MKYVVGNWKMNTTVREAVTLAGRIEDSLRDQLGEQDLPEVVLCPPFIALSPVQDVLDGTTISLGAQDCHWADHGAHTGEISATMLKTLVRYCLIGQNERRKASETDEHVARKVGAAARAGLIPIICVGEEDPNDIAIEHVAEQLDFALAEVDVPKLDTLLVAYEPEWATGSDVAADTNQVAEVTARLTEQLAEAGAARSVVLYGGNVTATTVGTFDGIPHLAGVLVGRSSLDEKELARIAAGVAAWQ